MHSHYFPSMTSREDLVLQFQDVKIVVKLKWRDADKNGEIDKYFIFIDRSDSGVNIVMIEFYPHSLLVHSFIWISSLPLTHLLSLCCSILFLHDFLFSQDFSPLLCHHTSQSVGNLLLPTELHVCSFSFIPTESSGSKVFFYHFPSCLSLSLLLYFFLWMNWSRWTEHLPLFSLKFFFLPFRSFPPASLVSRTRNLFCKTDTEERLEWFSSCKESGERDIDQPSKDLSWVCSITCSFTHIMLWFHTLSRQKLFLHIHQLLVKKNTVCLLFVASALNEEEARPESL